MFQGKLKRRGITLIELLGVMTIMVLLIGISSIAISKNIQRTNRESVQNELQVFANGLSDAYYDLGAPSIDPSDAGADEAIATFLKTLSDYYLSVTFDLSSVSKNTQGFSVDIKSPLDVYSEHYRCWFTTTGNSKYILIASGGDNCTIDSASYVSNNYGDDLVLILKP